MKTEDAVRRKPLRLWPGVIAAVLLAVFRFVLPSLWPEGMLVGVIGGFAGALTILVWWLFFSRAPWPERVAALAVMAAALAATPLILHESVAKGMMGVMFFFYAVPALTLAFVVWAVATRRLPDLPRRASMVATILLACGAWTVVRTGGITGDGKSDFHWRWSQTPEERLLAQARHEPAAARPASPDAPVPEPAKQAAQPAPSTPAVQRSPAGDLKQAAAHKEPEWPGFRGPNRDGVVRGVRINTDWTSSPPVEMWRRPVGPGWSSFAVHGDFFYTQEQRGDEEIVACYRVSTGEPVWTHRDAVRFWESNGGAGPRATPALSSGRVYTFGATGILNALDARSGAVVWSRNAASDTGAKLPGWGFAGSPLVVGDAVVVAASGALAAYDAGTGKPRWLGPAGRECYSSPHLLTIAGVPQVLLLSGSGAASVAPATGKLLWEHPWGGSAIVQPAQTADGGVLVTTASASGGSGLRRLAVANGSGGWTVKERWTSNGLKPYFNDYVVHEGHAYGFDGRILAAIDLQDGKRKWKGGRYGNGQLILLPDQDLLLVLSEDGELALVRATPDQFTELARFPVLTGKTWNHPVLAGDILLVRNGEEMAGFRLSPL